MPNGETQVNPQYQPQKHYEFLEEFKKRNTLIEAIEFALSNQCNCEACQKLRIAAEVLEEDRKRGRTSPLTP
jgi:hypothetical protein